MSITKEEVASRLSQKMILGSQKETAVKVVMDFIHEEIARAQAAVHESALKVEHALHLYTEADIDELKRVWTAASNLAIEQAVADAAKKEELVSPEDWAAIHGFLTAKQAKQMADLQCSTLLESSGLVSPEQAKAQADAAVAAAIQPIAGVGLTSAEALAPHLEPLAQSIEAVAAAQDMGAKRNMALEIAGQIRAYQPETPILAAAEIPEGGMPIIVGTKLEETAPVEVPAAE